MAALALHLCRQPLWRLNRIPLIKLAQHLLQFHATEQFVFVFFFALCCVLLALLPPFPNAQDWLTASRDIGVVGGRRDKEVRS